MLYSEVTEHCSGCRLLFAMPDNVGNADSMSTNPDLRRVSVHIPSPRERREGMRQEMIDAILEAAREIMRERGVAGLSLREVARRVQLQVSSLYEYFPNKIALYDALFALAVRRFYALKGETLAAAPDFFWDQVTAHITSYMAFAYAEPALYQLAFERPVPGFVPSEESMAVSISMISEFQHWLEDSRAAGHIRPEIPADEARDLMIAVMHGLTSQQIANAPESPPGTGRFGRLIPQAVAMLRVAWEPSPGIEERREETGS